MLRSDITKCIFISFLDHKRVILFDAITDFILGNDIIYYCSEDVIVSNIILVLVI